MAHTALEDPEALEGMEEEEEEEVEVEEAILVDRIDVAYRRIVLIRPAALGPPPFSSPVGALFLLFSDCICLSRFSRSPI